MPASTLEQVLAKRALILDGAMGTSIHQCDCDLHRDYLGKENCTEILVETRPDIIQGIHESFLRVGADAVETDTFARTTCFAEFDLAEHTYRLNKRAAKRPPPATTLHEGQAPSVRPRPRTRLVTPGTRPDDARLTLSSEGHRRGPRLSSRPADSSRWVPSTPAQGPRRRNCTRGRSPSWSRHHRDHRHHAARHETLPPPSCDPSRSSRSAQLRHRPRRDGRARQVALQALGPPSASSQRGLPILVDGRTEHPLKPRPFAEATPDLPRRTVSIVGGAGRLPAIENSCAAGDRRPNATRVAARRLLTRPPSPAGQLFLVVGELHQHQRQPQVQELRIQDFDGMNRWPASDQGRPTSSTCVDYRRDGHRHANSCTGSSARCCPAHADSTQVDVLEEAQARGRQVHHQLMNLEEGEEKLASSVNSRRPTAPPSSPERSTTTPRRRWAKPPSARPRSRAASTTSR